MNKFDLIEAIEHYETLDQREKTDRLLMLYFLKTAGAPCFDNDNTDGHITATCFIINKTGDQTLFLHHRALDRWFAPGGHCDGLPNVMEAARREGEEETGLTDLALVYPGIFDIDVHQIPANAKKNMPAHLHYSMTYLFQTQQTEFLCDEREAITMAWLDVQQALEKQPAPDYQRMVTKWQNFQHEGTLV